jgi:hypothetical protein
MPANAANIRRCLRDFEFANLFVEELGWNRYPSRPLAITTTVPTFTLRPVAEKGGFVVFRCDPGPDGGVPIDRDRQKIDRQAARTHHEHMIIYVDAARTIQIWQWVRRELGRPIQRREFTYRRGQTGEDLVQRLLGISFDLEEEEKKKAGIVVVIDKVRKTFDVDRVTKKFYDRFKVERGAFASFIAGIGSLGDQDWYASVMLNRLMFVYFIQKKSFLDSDENYLRRRLEQVQAKRGADQFLTFYRYFLLRLFHEGLGSQERSPELQALLGKVPYLNGGIFDVHALERQYSEIQIPDEAFKRIFDFFDSYRWHLDDRPLRDDDEINPDVLGYIFEKYVNQKEMGAYYTKEDITGYIAKNTIVPYLFDAARKECAIAFQPHSALWRLLRDDPDRYIYEAVRKGVDQPLPPEIEAGIAEVAKRDGWNRPADLAHALPTETWREHVSRRQRCLEIRAKLRAGEIQAIDDLITLNLDIRQFAQDAIEQCEGPELLRAFSKAIENVSVLDPTCGSGAFLFAALNILEPLYEACLERMEAFVGDLDRSGEKHRPEKFSDFRRVLALVAEHPGRQYFILKSIVVNNLYGVDIMEEAVEICKLRLFLKLVAQIEDVDKIEPLPDVDFNVRAGNTLVGFARLSDVERAVRTSGGNERLFLLPEDEAALREIGEKAEIANRASRAFHEMQTTYGMAAREFAGAKTELRGKLERLGAELDRYLAVLCRVNPKGGAAFDAWRASHQPFHWCVEFYGIMTGGGFGVIIGNPPYVEYAKVRNQYRVGTYKTLECGNLYAFAYERATLLGGAASRIGFIIPMSSFSTERMLPLSRLIRSVASSLWLSNYGVRPAKLFDGVNWRLSIVISSNVPANRHQLFTTKHYRWAGEERSALLALLKYGTSLVIADDRMVPKFSDPLAWSAWSKLAALLRSGLDLLVSRHATPYFVHYQEATQYWVKAMNRLPYYEKNGQHLPPAHARFLYLRTPAEAGLVCGIMNSSLFYLSFNLFSDCYHLGDAFVRAFPIASSLTQEPRIGALTDEMMDHLEGNATIEEIRTVRGDRIRYAALTYTGAKAVVDEIDRVLARHYGFTDEELEFIVNYDIKYRMGQDNLEGDGE